MSYRNLILPFLMLLVSLPLQAEQYKDFDDYRVHYNAFNSDMLTPDVAKAYGLSRSSYEAVLNITVQKKGKLGVYEPFKAKVKGKSGDITGKVSTLKMKEINEGPVVYYLAELPITNGQKLKFDVQIVPQGAKKSYHLSFSQQFFVK
jgi:hypothetical protein